LYLPVLESREIGKIVFAIDTSGSIDRDLLKTFISEIKDAMSIFSVSVTVIHCDTKVRKVEELMEDDDIVPEGRGGTEFQPVFDYVNQNLEETKAIVYFTDGGCWGGFKEPDCPVLWAMYGNSHFKCDFGEIIHVDQN
jgi:predicted metal-dependent peptidase